MQKYYDPAVRLIETWKLGNGIFEIIKRVLYVKETPAIIVKELD